MMEKGEDGNLTGGVSPDELIGKYGSPLYVYVAERIAAQYHMLKATLGPENLRIMYACKALSNINIIRFMKKLGAGLDVVSVEELELGLMAGFKPRDIIFTPSMVGPEDYDFAVKKGVRINVGDLEALEYIGENHRGQAVCVRLNPHVYAGGNEKISVGHEHSKFGISIFHLPEILRLTKKYSIPVEGLHIHVGSDIQDDEQYIRAIGVLFDHARHFTGIRYLDIGSGFKVPYWRGGRSSNLELLGKFIRKERSSLEEHFQRDIEILTEPGKILVSECGVFLTTVNTIKKGPVGTFAGLNTGFNHFLRPMFYDTEHEMLNLSNPDGKLKEYDLVGYICETDNFAKRRKMPELRPGDTVAFLNAGAYAFNMSSNYNNKPRPAEVLIYKGKDYLIRRREDLEDLLATTIDAGIF